MFKFRIYVYIIPCNQCDDFQHPLPYSASTSTFNTHFPIQHPLPFSTPTSLFTFISTFTNYILLYIARLILFAVFGRNIDYYDSNYSNEKKAHCCKNQSGNYNIFSVACFHIILLLYYLCFGSL